MRSAMAGLALSAALAGPAGAQQAFEEPAGELHYLSLSAGDGYLAAPSTLSRQGDEASVWVLTVHGEPRRVAEGDVRWTWGLQRFDCDGRTFAETPLHAFGEDGTLVGSVSSDHRWPINTPSREALWAYACQGARPAHFSIAPDRATAVAVLVAHLRKPAPQ